MKSLFYVPITLTVCGLTLSLQDSTPGPFGITFTPKTIIASRFNSSGAIEIAKFPVGSEYRAYLANAVDKFGLDINTIHNMDMAEPMFRSEMIPVNKSLEKQLGYTPDYSAVFLPSVFQYQVKNAAMDALFLADYHKHPVMGGLSRQAVCYGYGFLEGKNLGRSPEECNDEGPLNMVLVLEYEVEYLYAWFMEVHFELETFPVHHSEFCRECGEYNRKDMGAQAYSELLNRFLSTFINSQVPSNFERENIRAIVIAGETSHLSVVELGHITRSASGS